MNLFAQSTEAHPSLGEGVMAMDDVHVHPTCVNMTPKCPCPEAGRTAELAGVRALWREAGCAGAGHPLKERMSDDD
jgi:hypothetical protein